MYVRLKLSLKSCQELILTFGSSGTAFMLFYNLNIVKENVKLDYVCIM